MLAQFVFSVTWIFPFNESAAIGELKCGEEKKPEREIFEIEMWPKCVSSEGERGKSVYLGGNFISQTFLSTGKHWILEWVYFCVDEHLTLGFILDNARKHYFILPNIGFKHNFALPNILFKHYFILPNICFKHYFILGNSRKHYWGSIQRGGHCIQARQLFQAVYNMKAFSI